MRFVRGLLSCNIASSFKSQVLHQSKQPFYMRENSFLSKRCKKVKKCANTTFINEICQQANIHVMKIIRLSLKWAWSLLKDENLDLQIIYLARDPRAVLQSRSKVHFCGDKTCGDPKTVCKLLEDDLHEADKMLLAFPKKFTFIQYEKVSSDLLKNLKDIMSFVGLDVSDGQRKLIKRQATPHKRFTTRKNSSKQVNAWRMTSTFSRVLSR